MLAQMHKIVKRNDVLTEGDILFFRHGRRITHVGMYIGDHKFIHAATERRGVVIDDLRGAYYQRSFMVAGRLYLQKSFANAITPAHTLPHTMMSGLDNGSNFTTQQQTQSTTNNTFHKVIGVSGL